VYKEYLQELKQIDTDDLAYMKAIYGNFYSRNNILRNFLEDNAESRKRST